MIADDTYRSACLGRTPPQARCAVKRRSSPHYVGRDPDGWGVFRKSGKWAKRVIQVHVEGTFSDGNKPPGTIDPQGCAFDAKGNLWGTDVGNQMSRNGALIVFFPGKRKRYDTYCFVDKALGAPGMPEIDQAGNLYVPEPFAGRVTKFSPPFPKSAADCANPERLVTRPPTKTTFATGGTVTTPAGIARVPGTDRFYLGNIILSPRIDEYDALGMLVRTVVPDGLPRNPLGIDVGTDGTMYYAELNLDPVIFDTRCGSVSRVRFAGGQPQAPEEIGRRLRFPDGVTVVDSKQLRVRWDTLPPAPDVDPSGCGGE